MWLEQERPLENACQPAYTGKAEKAWVLHEITGKQRIFIFQVEISKNTCVIFFKIPCFKWLFGLTKQLRVPDRKAPTTLLGDKFVTSKAN